MKTKTKVLSSVALGLLVVLGVSVYTSGSLENLQGRFGATGGVTLDLASDTPREDIVVAGDTDVEVSKYSLTATKEAFIVTDLQVNNMGTMGDMDNNISVVTLQYEDSSGSTVEENGYLVTGVVTFSGLDLYVPKDDTADLEVFVGLNAISSSGTSATSGEKIQLYVAATGFTAVGQTTGRTATAFSGSGTTKPNKMHVYETKPTLALASTSPSGSRSVSASDDAFDFTVEADSNEKVVMKNLRILLDSDADFDTTALTAATLKTGGTTVATAKVNFTDDSSAYVLFTFAEEEVTKGSTKTYTLTLDTATLLNEDSGMDDPLSASIDLGSSGSAGGFKWNDTNSDVTWVGNVSSSTLTGNTLLY